MPDLPFAAVGLVSPSTAMYGGLFAWSFLAATVLPLSSEALLAAVVYTTRHSTAPVVVATVGNYLGACTTYALARWAANKAGLLQNDAGVQGSAIRLVTQYGAPMMLLSWVPLLGDALVAVAGALAMPFLRFSVLVIVGKAARYFAVAWVVLKV